VRNLYYLTLVLTLYPITLVQYKLPFTLISLFFFSKAAVYQSHFTNICFLGNRVPVIIYRPVKSRPNKICGSQRQFECP